MAFGKKQQQSSSEISREELTRTQVLNLQELERVAKFERQTSKRPAFLFAFAGALAITMGLLYPNIMMAVDNIDFNEEPKTSYRVDLDNNYDTEALPVPTDKVVCSIYQPYQVDGTDKTTTYELYFNDQKLKTYVKTSLTVPTAGNPAGITVAQNVYNTYIAYNEIGIKGYKIESFAENAAARVAVSIDLKQIDRTQLTYALVANPFTNVEYSLDDDQTAVQTALTAAGYICTVEDTQPLQ